MERKLSLPVPVLAGLLALLMVSLPAAAHHVRHEVARGEAVVVSLAYGDGSPLAYDRYDIFAEGAETPYQSGNTDAGGRIVFMPDRTCVWRVKVFSEDGHGADFTIEAGPAKAAAAETDDAEQAEVVGTAGEAAAPGDPVTDTWTPEVAAAEKKRFIERFAGPVLGVGIIFGLFGLFALFIRRRR